MSRSTQRLVEVSIIIVSTILTIIGVYIFLHALDDGNGAAVFIGFAFVGWGIMLMLSRNEKGDES